MHVARCVSAEYPSTKQLLKIEFETDDIDTAHERLRAHDETYDWVREPPVDMPWGTRTVVLRDADGHLVELYTPIGDEA